MFKNKIKQTALYQKIAGFLRGVVDGFKSIKGIQKKWAFLGTHFIHLAYVLPNDLCLLFCY